MTQRIRSTFTLLLLALAVSLCPAHAQVRNMVQDGGTISSSGSTIIIQNAVGGATTSIEVKVTGAPSTVSVVTKGCMRGGTCDTLETYTTVADSIRTPNTNSKVYDYYKVTASWTGGTSPTVTANLTVSTAKTGGGGGGGGGAVSSVNGQTGVVTVTSTDVGLGNADNTSDVNKPVSTAQQAAINAKADKTTTVNSHPLSSNVTVTPADLSLGNVDNTHDTDKPISTAAQAVLDVKVEGTTTSTNNEIPRYDLTGGKRVKNGSGCTVASGEIDCGVGTTRIKWEPLTVSGLSSLVSEVDDVAIVTDGPSCASGGGSNRVACQCTSAVGTTCTAWTPLTGPSTGGCISGTPASPTASSSPGECQYDANYLYESIGTNSWKRVPWDTWSGSQASTPTFSPVAGAVASGTTINVATATGGCGGYIYWNTTGSVTSGDNHSTTTSAVTGSTTFYAKVIGCPTFSDSNQGSSAYTVSGGGGGSLALVTAGVSSGGNGGVSSVDATARVHTAGNLLDVSCSYRNACSGTMTVTNTAGDTFAQIGSNIDNSSTMCMGRFYAKNIIGHASDVVTCHYPTTEPNTSISVEEVSGASTTSPLIDFSTATVSNSSTATTPADMTSSAASIGICGLQSFSSVVPVSNWVPGNIAGTAGAIPTNASESSYSATLTSFYASFGSTFTNQSGSGANDGGGSVVTIGCAVYQ